MATLKIIDRSGEERSVAAKEGYSVMEIIRNSGFGDIAALCAGCCSCATCHIYVGADFADRLAPLGSDENEMLDISDARAETSRLACQIQFTADLDGMTVTVAPED
jgi:2Fe-2S ferredoxin